MFCVLEHLNVVTFFSSFCLDGVWLYQLKDASGEESHWYRAPRKGGVPTWARGSSYRQESRAVALRPYNVVARNPPPGWVRVVFWGPTVRVTWHVRVPLKCGTPLRSAMALASSPLKCGTPPHLAMKTRPPLMWSCSLNIRAQILQMCYCCFACSIFC